MALDFQTAFYQNRKQIKDNVSGFLELPVNRKIGVLRIYVGKSKILSA
jgi:hypothetical protein